MKKIAMLLLLTMTLWLNAGESPSEPAPRNREYNWMSIASWKQRHENFLKRAKEGNIDILFLGDSITEGWGGNAVWQKHYALLKAANFGIGGDTTQNVLWRITTGGEIEGLSPKVIVLMIGTNNFGLHGDKPDDVAGGVETIVKTLRTKLPAAKILLLGLFPRDQKPESHFRTKIKAVNERIAKLDDKQTIRYMDIGADLSNPDGTLSKDVMPDYLHLSQKGYEIWAEKMNPLLMQMLGK